MNEMEKSRSRGFSALFFLTGAAVGSGIALLMARNTGHDTRENLKACLSDVGNKAQGYLEKGKHYVEDLQNKMKTGMRSEETHLHS